MASRAQSSCSSPCSASSQTYSRQHTAPSGTDCHALTDGQQLLIWGQSHTQAIDGAVGLWGCPSQVTNYFGDTHTHQPSWRGCCTCRPKRAVPWSAFTCSGDHPFQAKMAEKEELLLICKQMQPVLLLGTGSSCTLLAG